MNNLTFEEDEAQYMAAISSVRKAHAELCAQYRFSLERWHQSKRELPHLVQPLPEPPMGLAASTADKIKSEVMREYVK